METSELISRLAEQPAPRCAGACPYSMVSRWLGVTFGGIIIMVAFLGLRPDLSLRLAEPLFLAEIAVLFLLLVASGMSACWLAFPDQRQQPWLVKLPLVPLTVYAALIAYRLSVPEATAAPLEKDNGIDCALCITGMAIVPAFTLLYLVRRCATTVPRLTGAVALLAAAVSGHLMLKFVEANDSLPHFAVSHLLPILLLCGIGFLLGKKILAW
jgi:hypothetical protein